MKNKVEIIKQSNIMKCWSCDGKGYIIPPFNSIAIFGFRNICKNCNGTGVYDETTYIHIVNGIAFSGDTIK